MGAETVVDRLSRVGLVAYGLVYLLIGWLAVQVAVGDRAGGVSKSGALHTLAEQPLGSVLLWVATCGFAALVVWQAIEALFRQEKLLGRLHAATRTGIFALLGYSAAKTAAGNPSREGTDGFTSWLMSKPLGTWLVAAVGLAVIAFAVFSVVTGVTDKYRKDLDLDGRIGRVGTLLTVLARAGYCSRGVAFGIVGSLFVWAAVTHDPRKSGGLDVALHKLLDAPLGPVLLVAVGAGFACYGAFNVAKAKHQKRQTL